MRACLLLHLHWKLLIPRVPSFSVGRGFTYVSRDVMAGGGGILVPIFILIMGFSPKYAIPLSNVTILGGSIMNMVMNVKKR